jgi:hypothetical protein
LDGGERVAGPPGRCRAWASVLCAVAEMPALQVRASHGFGVGARHHSTVSLLNPVDLLHCRAGAPWWGQMDTAQSSVLRCAGRQAAEGSCMLMPASAMPTNALFLFTPSGYVRLPAVGANSQLQTPYSVLAKDVVVVVGGAEEYNISGVVVVTASTATSIYTTGELGIYV